MVFNLIWFQLTLYKMFNTEQINNLFIIQDFSLKKENICFNINKTQNICK